MPNRSDFASVPAELAGRPQWLCWSLEMKGGKTTKVPHDAKTGGAGSSTDPNTWATFDEACTACEDGRYGFSGIGFVFAGDRSVTGLDLDHVLDEEGRLDPDYQWVVDEAGTYIEVSPSGDGLHLLFLGGKPEGAEKCKKAQGNGRVVEMYDHSRFFTFTGNVYVDANGVRRDNISSNPEVLQRAYETWLAPVPAPALAPQRKMPTFAMDDQEVLNLMYASAKGEEIRALMEGDTSGSNGDNSAADLALCNRLAFYTGKDAVQMDRIFRGSGLMRPKWDEMRGDQTYGRMTINKAISDTTSVYDPNFRNEPQVLIATIEKDANLPAPPQNNKQLKVSDIVRIVSDLPFASSLKFNIMEKRPYIIGSVPWSSETAERPFEGVDRSQLFSVVQDRAPKVKTEDFNRALDIVFDRGKFNPLANMLDQLRGTWDGKPRLGTGMNVFLGAEDTEYNREVEKLFFRAAMRRAYQPGCKFDSMVVLVGPQGVGKSTYFRTMAVDERFFTDNVTGIGTPTASMLVQGVLVVEIAELASFNKKEVEVVKGWITQQNDDYIPKYVRDKEYHPRYFVIGGTTNSPQFLTDASGNRRFLPVRCGIVEPTLDLSFMAEWMRQAWAECLEVYKEDDTPLVLPESVLEAAAEAQDSAAMEDPRIGIIGGWLEKHDAERVCSAQIVQECLDIHKNDLRYKATTREVNDIMAFNFPQWKRLDGKKKTQGYGTQRVYQKLPIVASLFEGGNLE